MPGNIFTIFSVNFNSFNAREVMEDIKMVSLPLFIMYIFMDAKVQ